MKEIPLTQGKTALVDDADYDWLMKWKWHARRHSHLWYAARFERVNGKGRTVLMHREILKPPPWLFTDHIDRDGLNNQRHNLRACTQKENAQNSGPAIKARERVEAALRAKEQDRLALEEEMLAEARIYDLPARTKIETTSENGALSGRKRDGKERGRHHLSH